jgi:AraC-like DNA-binding protein
MRPVQYYRDGALPFLELKVCRSQELSYKKHSHEEFSLGIVTQGRSLFWYDGKTETIQPESLVCLPPGLVHACNPVDPNAWEYAMLFIDTAWLQAYMEQADRFLFRDPIVQPVVSPEVLSTLRQAVAVLTSCAGPLEKEGCVFAIFEQVSCEQDGRYLAETRDQPQLTKAAEFLQSRFLEPVTLAAMAQAAGLDKFQLIRQFNQTFKIPPHTYQTLLRINYAKKALRQNMPIAEVAQEAGFYDQSHFCKAFKNHTGITPEKYQKLR